MNHKVKLFSPIFAGLVLLLAHRTSFAQSEKPNIVFILIDDMGWRDLGCYGSSFYESPNIDQLAQEGRRFTNAYVAAPVCAPSRASIMTGKNPARPAITSWRSGKGEFNEPKPWQKLKTQRIDYLLPQAEDNVAKRLKALDYRTFLAGKWHLGEEENLWPENQGFDVNKGGWSAGSPTGVMQYDEKTDTPTLKRGYFSPYHNPRLKDGKPGENLTDRLTSETISFLQKHRHEPFFVYLSYHSVHNPMDPKEEYLKKFQDKARKIGLDSIQPFVTHKPWMRPNPTNDSWKERLVQSNAHYAAMIYNLDKNIGRLVDALEKLSLKENTVVVLTSDNGGLSTQESSVTSNLPLRAGKGWLYEGGIRVPLIVRWPATVSAGEVSDAFVTGTDYFPTFLEIAGGSLKENEIDGKSFVPHLKDKTVQVRDTLYWHNPHYYRKGSRPASAIRVGNYKLIKNYESGRLELYDLKNDIAEAYNLSDSLADKATELESALTTWLTARKALIPLQNVVYDQKYDKK